VPGAWPERPGGAAAKSGNERREALPLANGEEAGQVVLVGAHFVEQ
jgi:hypothetical protein